MYIRSTPHSRPRIPYADALDVWSALGFAVVPAGLDKRPAVPFGLFSLYARPDQGHRAPTAAEVAEWRLEHAQADAGCLVLDSRLDLGLAVVDIDREDPALLAWVEATFGASPLHVSSGRGTHVFYRAPESTRVTSRSGLIGPAEAFEERAGHLLVSPIDVKSAGAYVLASGSWHAKRERPYTASVEVTESLLQSLPVFDVAAYEAQAEEIKSLRRAGIRPAELASMTHADRRRAIERDRRSVTMARAGYRVPSYEDVGPAGWEISEEEVGGLPERPRRILCPRHANTDTPAGSLHSYDGEWFLTCHGACDQSWRVVTAAELWTSAAALASNSTTTRAASSTAPTCTAPAAGRIHARGGGCRLR